MFVLLRLLSGFAIADRLDIFLLVLIQVLVVKNASKDPRIMMRTMHCNIDANEHMICSNFVLCFFGEISAKDDRQDIIG